MAARMKDEAVQEKVDQLSKALTEIEEQLHQTKLESSQDVLNYPPQLDNQLVFLQSVVESAAGRPTVGSKERFQELQAELVRLETELDNVLETRLPEIERLLEEAGTPRIVVEPADEEEDSKE
jgi:alpha-ketoglutarate-dependent taurine dioxygenase